MCVGVNSRRDAIQAAIMKVRHDAFEARRLDAVNEVAALYSEAFSGSRLLYPEAPVGCL